MKAVVIHEAGGPKVLKIETQPVPRPKSGEVLIRVKAFGLNRSELFTRQGHSPGVKFPESLALRRSASLTRRPEASSAVVMLSQPRWAAWGGNSMGVMPNITAYPRVRCRFSKPDCSGERSARCRRCCKQLGARCSSPFASKEMNACCPRRNHLGRTRCAGYRQEPRRLRRSHDSQSWPGGTAAFKWRGSSVY